MQHDDEARKDLFQVMEAFSKEKDADGKMVGPVFKIMKSEFVALQEAISAKKYDLHDEKQHDQPEGAFTQRNMNRSRQSWVKTLCKMSWMNRDRYRNRLAQPNVERAVRAHGNLVLRKAMLLSKQQKVAWDSQTRIRNRTDTQTRKVWTIQMMMTLILTTSLRVKTNTD
jgi:hypothetical protein